MHIDTFIYGTSKLKKVQSRIQTNFLFLFFFHFLFLEDAEAKRQIKSERQRRETGLEAKEFKKERKGLL